ncbi:MAG: tetratricopeptide repeat protein [Candidatus Ozemobacteraceae bacterium]
MKQRIIGSVLLATVLFIFGTAFAQDGTDQLQAAKNAMERGRFEVAISRFTDISRNSSYPRPVVKEAAYYVGFCYVKMSDPWKAIQVCESFLERFDNSSDRSFISDAMYVLGRAFEETKKFDDAVVIYRRCADRFHSTEFGNKSRDRISMICSGGSHHGGGDSLEITQKVLGRDNPSFIISLSTEAAPVCTMKNTPTTNESRNAKTTVAKKTSKVDPFEGFNLDQAKIGRVSRFLEAVKTRSGIEGQAKYLAKEDSSMDIMKSALKDSARIKQFESLHENNK